MSSRITKKMLEGLVEDWNKGHEDIPLTISIYNGLYHIGHADTHTYFITEETASKAFNCFMVWKDGFHEGGR